MGFSHFPFSLCNRSFPLRIELQGFPFFFFFFFFLYALLFFSPFCREYVLISRYPDFPRPPPTLHPRVAPSAPKYPPSSRTTLALFCFAERLRPLRNPLFYCTFFLFPPTLTDDSDPFIVRLSSRDRSTTRGYRLFFRRLVFGTLRPVRYLFLFFFLE